MFNNSQVMLVDEQDRDPSGNPLGRIKERPPFLVMIDPAVLGKNPELEPYRVTPEYIDNQWAGQDTVYLRFDDRTRMVELLREHLAFDAGVPGWVADAARRFGLDLHAFPWRVHLFVQAEDAEPVNRRLNRLLRDEGDNLTVQLSRAPDEEPIYVGASGAFSRLQLEGMSAILRDYPGCGLFVSPNIAEETPVDDASTILEVDGFEARLRLPPM